MNTVDKPFYKEINGVDNNGEFCIQIQKDCSQLRIHTNDSFGYIDINYRELKAIAEAINEVLNGFDKHINQVTCSNS